MSSVNKAIILGRLGADPEVRFTQNNTPVASLSIATSESYKDKATGEKVEKTEWHRVTLWNRTAEVAQQYLKKGSLVYIEGKLETREWEKDGVKRYSTEIVGREMKMLSSSGQGNGQAPAPGAPANSAGKSPMSSNTQIGSNFDDMDDDLPF